MAGTLNTSEIATVTFKLNELNHTATITHVMHVYSDKMEYDMIIGQDSLHELGIILDFKNKIESSKIKADRVKLDKSTQKESITFASNTSVFISEEKTIGPNLLYLFSW